MRFFERHRHRKAIQHAADVLRAHNSAEQLPARIHKRIEMDTGMPALEGEGVHEHLARAGGVPIEDLQKYLDLLGAGVPVDEAERAVPSVARSVHPSLRGIPSRQ